MQFNTKSLFVCFTIQLRGEKLQHVAASKNILSGRVMICLLYNIWELRWIMFNVRDKCAACISHLQQVRMSDFAVKTVIVLLRRCMLLLHDGIFYHPECVSCSHPQACPASMSALVWENISAYSVSICVKMFRHEAWQTGGLAECRVKYGVLIRRGSLTAASRRCWAGYELATCLTSV